MRYLDPESQPQRTQSPRYDSRHLPTDYRNQRPPRHQPAPHARGGADVDRWQKGTVLGRPTFESLDREMERYTQARVISSDHLYDDTGRNPSRSRSRSRSPVRIKGRADVVEEKKNRESLPPRERMRSRSYEGRAVSPARSASPRSRRAASASGSDMSMDKED
jgi:hypothetical protein